MSAHRVIGFCSVTVLLAAGMGWAQLDPPPGPVMPTMKPLDEVEPRTPIRELPYVISDSGSYYLAGNLELETENAHGITIEANGVTLDLAGFELIGPGQGSGSGISGAVLENITVHNGTVRDWGSAGVLLSVASDVVCEGLRAFDNGGSGINIGTRGVVLNCIATRNGGNGIASGAHSRIEGVTASLNGNEGISVASRSIVANSTAASNGTDGISTIGPGMVTGNICSSNGANGIERTSGSGSIVRDNVCNNNGLHGIDVAFAYVTDNFCNDNTVNGIRLHSPGNVVERNFVRNNAVGIGVNAAVNVNYFASNRATANTTDYSLGNNPVVGAGTHANVSF